MQIITTRILPPSPLISQNRSGHGEVPTRVLEICYCPSMDLVASYPKILLNHNPISGQISHAHGPNGSSNLRDDEPEEQSVDIEIYRLNGERVFCVNIEGEGDNFGITDVAWRSDGIILAVITSDNLIRLINTFSGKVVHKLSSISTFKSIPGSVAKPSPSKRHSTALSQNITRQLERVPSRLSYTTHFLSPILTRSQLASANQEFGLVLDDLLGLNTDLAGLLKSKADLPKELASLDVESYLPKLACLPTTSLIDDDVFSTRTSIDSIFHPVDRGVKSGTVEALLAGSNKGLIHLRIFDSFEVGDISLADAAHVPRNLKLQNLRSSAGHPFSQHIFSIVEEQDDSPASRNTRSHGDVPSDGKVLHLMSLDLKFLQHSSHSLPILANKATQLRNLTRYLKQIEIQVGREVKAAFDLPTRFIRNVNEDLMEQDGNGSSFESAAYHAILTGEVHGKLKEWLTDQVGDRGIKRWEKSVGDCLDLVRRLISETWNPAAERAGVVISRLSGLATSTDAFGLDKKIVEGLRDTIGVMAIVGEDILKEVNLEITEFAAFIRWLKWEVEAAGLEDTSERLEEMRENNDHGEVRKVLKYIHGGLNESAVKKYITSSSVEEQNESTVKCHDDIGFYASFKENRQKLSHPPVLKAILKRLEQQCNNMFEQVANTLKKHVMVEYLQMLPNEIDDKIIDLRVLPADDLRDTNRSASKGSFCIYIVGKHRQKQGTVKCVWLWFDGQQKSSRPFPETNKTSSKELKVEQAEEVIDVRFVDDEQFMVLVATRKDRRIYSYNILDPTNWELRHVFDQSLMEAGMKPCRLEINGRKNRRAVAVVDEDGKGYVVFDLDSGDAGEGVSELEDKMTG